MASLTISSTGAASVYVTLPGGERKHVGIGKISQQHDERKREAARQRVERVRWYITELEAWQLKGMEPSSPAKAWLAGTRGKLRERLAECGLCEADSRQRVTLAEFIDAYLAQRVDVKSGTMLVMRQARRTLIRLIGDDKPVDRVTPADADAFRAALQGKGLARATVNKWCQYARQFFEVAKRRKLIAENPFAHIKGQVRGNVKRRAFVTAADMLKVIDQAADPQWKLLIGLARFGGLRIPSEALAMTWGDVDLENKRFTVRASKTEHHEDGGVRIVPMFPELVPLFDAVLPDAAEGAVHVISRYRDPAGNLRTQLGRYITAAGLAPWPKPWQNLRASRATELADKFPSHVCAAWLGHTPAVADEFYRQVTDEHYAKAVTDMTVRAAVRPSDASDRVEHATPDRTRIETHQDAGLTQEVGAVGTEHPHKSPKKTRGSGADHAHTMRAATTLADWLDACPLELDPPTRVRVQDAIRQGGRL